MLDTCGQYFDRGSSRKRLDAFLVYFQCYLFTKRQPQPLEVRREGGLKGRKEREEGGREGGRESEEGEGGRQGE